MTRVARAAREHSPAAMSGALRDTTFSAPSAVEICFTNARSRFSVFDVSICLRRVSSSIAANERA